ncbi:hypothetical protein GF312_00760 [Candidatus Poribacteria bacterium]|nr:hypothetical protein [Candidatus Poribacteria bacterium]
MLKAAILVTIYTLLFCFLTGCAVGLEFKPISPIGAVSRSVIPGWGQIYTGSKLEGIVVFMSVAALAGGGLQADIRYRDYYKNKYEPAVLSDSSQADIYFDRANQYYKLSRFLLYAAGGIWAYSIIDAYIDAHVYNAQQQTKILNIDDEGLQELKLKDEIGFRRKPSGCELFLLTNNNMRLKRNTLNLSKPDSLFSPVFYFSPKTLQEVIRSGS